MTSREVQIGEGRPVWRDEPPPGAPKLGPFAAIDEFLEENPEALDVNTTSKKRRRNGVTS